VRRKTRQRAEGRGQRAEGRGEGRGQREEGRGKREGGKEGREAEDTSEISITIFVKYHPVVGQLGKYLHVATG
jgi:hypothetical protein